MRSLLAALSFDAIDGAQLYVTAVPDPSRVEVGATFTVQIAPCSLDCPAIPSEPLDLSAFSVFRVETLERDILWSGQASSELVLGPVPVDAGLPGRPLMLLVTVPVDEYRQIVNPGINDFAVFCGYAPVLEFQVDVIVRAPGFPWGWAVGFLMLLGLGALVFRRQRLSLPHQL